MGLQDKIARLDFEITEKQRELDALNEQARALAANEPRAIADAIHEHECHSNHTDGCSWFYEKWEEAEEGQGHAKVRYLGYARSLAAWAKANDLPIGKVVEARTMSLSQTDSAD